MENTEDFGNKVKTLRKSLGLTQTELAKKVGLNAHTIKDYEANRRRPSWDAAARLASALGVSQKDLFSEGVAEVKKQNDFFDLIEKISTLDSKNRERLVKTIDVMLEGQKMVSKKGAKEA